MADWRWDPFRDLVSIQDQMNRWFQDTFYRARYTEEELVRVAWSPAVDVSETDQYIIVKAALPGVSQKDIRLEVTDNQLTLKGEKELESTERENYHLVEIPHGKFYRSFTLPGNIDHSKIQADFKNGILKIILPKKQAAKPKQIPIQEK